jgi:hypothetical protein
MSPTRWSMLGAGGALLVGLAFADPVFHDQPEVCAQAGLDKIQNRLR